MTPDPATLATAINAVTELRDQCTDAQGREWEALDAALDALHAIRVSRPISARQDRELSNLMDCLGSAAVDFAEGKSGQGWLDARQLMRAWVHELRNPTPKPAKAEATPENSMRKVG